MAEAGLRLAAAEELPEYELNELLGRGSFGFVFSSTQRSTGESCALKVMPLPEEATSAGEQLRSEVAMLQECKHANIVLYLASALGRAHFYMVMEQCSGGSIRDVLNARGSALSEEAIAFVCREAAQGLAYLHGLAKVHRDIKASNILLTADGNVKLADFGVAVQLTRTVSKRNTFVGTPHWMAPEIIAESRYDAKVDIWALGITALEMAEFQPPRYSMHPMRVVFAISRDPPPTLAEPDAWSHAMGAFVAGCLQKNARLRPNALELLRHKFLTAVPAHPDCLLAEVAGTRRWLAEQRAAAAAATEEAAAAELAPPPEAEAAPFGSPSAVAESAAAAEAGETPSDVPPAAPTPGEASLEQPRLAPQLAGSASTAERPSPPLPPPGTTPDASLSSLVKAEAPPAPPASIFSPTHTHGSGSWRSRAPPLGGSLAGSSFGLASRRTAGASSSTGTSWRSEVAAARAWADEALGSLEAGAVERVLALAGAEHPARPYLRCSELPLESLLQAAPGPADRVREAWDWEGESEGEGAAEGEEAALAEALRELRKRGGGVEFDLELFDREEEEAPEAGGERAPPRLPPSLRAALRARPELLALCRALAARRRAAQGACNAEDRAAGEHIAGAVLFAASSA